MAPQQVAVQAHICEAVRCIPHEPSCRSHMVILQRGNVIVCHCQGVPGLNQKVVVHSTVLVVMDGSRQVTPKRCQVIEDLAFQETAMHHDHVHHLDHTRHMETAQPHNMGAL